MEPQSVETFDLMRVFFGDRNALFFLEITLRTLTIYAYALLLLRWGGSRTVGQLSMVEFLLVIALGSAVGDPMFYPDVPVLHGLTVVTVVVLANKGLDLLIARSKAAERVLDGRPHQVIASGVLSGTFRPGGGMGHSELFQQLRQHGIRHLGEVEAAYVEPDGALSLFPAHSDERRPGLPIAPPWEVAHPVPLAHDRPMPSRQFLSCLRCGTTGIVPDGMAPGRCPCCGYHRWTLAADDRRAPLGNGDKQYNILKPLAISPPPLT